MARIGALAVLLSVFLPLAAQGQARPSNSMHTRSAEVYLERVKGASRLEEKKALAEKALEVLAQGMRTDADNPRVWFLAGQAHARLGNTAAADSAFDRALGLYPEYEKQIDPERLDLWIREYNAGVQAIQAANADQAIARFEQADRVYRKRPDALISLASLYARKGDFAGAEKAYREALEVIRGPAGQGLDEETAAEWKEKEEVAANQLAALLADSGKPKQAETIYRELLARQPGNVQIINNLAVALSRAGKNEEAARVDAELISRSDLNEIVLFNMGVRFYGAQQFELAADAFRRALQSNPHSNDALYNLGQALVAGAAKADEERKSATGEQVKAAAARALHLYQELLECSSKLNIVDPQNRNVLMMMAQAQRSLGELEADPAKAEPWKKKVLETLEQAEALDFEVSQVTVGTEEDVMTLNGSFTNRKLTTGQSVTLRFTFLGATGTTIATHDVAVPAPAPGGSVSLTAQVKTSQPVAGWQYQAVR